MSSRAHRRRSKAAGNGKQAFEDDDSQAETTIEAGADARDVASDLAGIDFERFYESAFFTLRNSTVEVILDKNILTWSKVSGGGPAEQKPANRVTVDSIDLRNVYAVSPMYNHDSWLLSSVDSQSTTSVSDLSSSSANLTLRGFQLHTCEATDDGLLQEVLILFQSNLPAQIQRWYELLSKYIAENRVVRSVLVICNPNAGSRDGQHVYRTKIQPVLERAHYKVTYAEMDDVCSVTQIFDEFSKEFNTLYGLVIVGGDGSVISVANALIRYLAKENRTRLDTEHDLPPLPFPICIIPTGTTNLICHSIYGGVDHCMPIFHLLFGSLSHVSGFDHQMRIDMSAVFDADCDFITVNFSAAAGYAANALRYFTRYSSSNPKKVVQKSFAKAAASKNLRPLDVHIRYIPVEHDPNDPTRCIAGCVICAPLSCEQTAGEVRAFDDAHMRRRDGKKKHAASKAHLHPDHTGSAQWKLLRQEYLHVGIFTNAGLWSWAPQGLSKFGHLADGSLDLVLIEQTSRKELLRAIKRHGNSKNQHDFPFTTVIKVKEIEIELKLSEEYSAAESRNPHARPDSSPSDNSSGEERFTSDHRSSPSMSKHEPYLANKSISDHHRARGSPADRQRFEKHLENAHMHSSRSITSFYRKEEPHASKPKVDKARLPRRSIASNEERIRAQSNRHSTVGSLRSAKSFLNMFTGGHSAAERRKSSSPAISGQPSYIEQERGRAPGNRRYENEKQPCMWNLDFTPYNSPLVRIKCFHRYLPVFGLGPHANALRREVHYSCFGRLG